MAKKKDVNIDELDDESGKSGKLVSILVAMLIIVIWLVIFALLIKMMSAVLEVVYGHILKMFR